MRASRGEIIIAGSSSSAEGEVTVNQAITTANVFLVIPATNDQSVVAALTVPAEKRLLIRSLRAAMALGGGSSGSAQLLFMVRRIGEIFLAKRDYRVTQAYPLDAPGLLVPAKSDVKWRVNSVSSNNTIISGSFDYLLVDEKF